MENTENRLQFLKLSNQYLCLVETIMDELILHENRNFHISDKEITKEDFLLATNWNDSNFAEPFFFIFYHGIELLLKGFLINPKGNHKISKLFDDFNKNVHNNLVCEILKKYINENEKLVEPFKSFFIKNKITVDQFYNALRYPMTLNRDKIFNHDEIKQFDDNELSFYNKTKEDINNLRIEVVKLGVEFLQQIHK